MIVVLKGSTLVINLTMEIHKWWGISYDDIRLGLAEYEGQFTKVKMVVNSPGGSVTDGMAIRNEILNLVEAGIEVDIEVMGVAASIASVIALSGTSLKMRTGSYLMIHEPTTITQGNWKQLENMSSTLKKMHDDLIDIYEGASSLERDEIENFVENETWFTAKEAVANGFASKIILAGKNEAQNSSNSIPKSEMWETFENVPENLSTNLDGQDDEPDSKKETFMNLKEATAAHPEIQNEVDTQVQGAAKAEATRITSLIALAGGKVTALVQEGIDNNWSEEKLALAMVKAGDMPQNNGEEEEVPAQTPAPQTPEAPVNNTNLVPAATPQNGLKTDAEIAAEAEDKEIDNFLNELFPSKGDA